MKPDLTPNINIRDLLVFQLPPSLAGMADTGGLVMVLEAYQESGADAACDVDFIQVTPVDGFNQFTMFSGLERNGGFIIDGINEVTHRVSTTGTPNYYQSLRASFATMTGSWIMLQPGRDQRIYVLQHGSTDGASYIAAQMKCKLYFRPRRLTL